MSVLVKRDQISASRVLEWASSGRLLLQNCGGKSWRMAAAIVIILPSQVSPSNQLGVGWPILPMHATKPKRASFTTASHQASYSHSTSYHCSLLHSPPLSLIKARESDPRRAAHLTTLVSRNAAPLEEGNYTRSNPKLRSLRYPISRQVAPLVNNPIHHTSWRHVYRATTNQGDFDGDRDTTPRRRHWIRTRGIDDCIPTRARGRRRVVDRQGMCVSQIRAVCSARSRCAGHLSRAGRGRTVADPRRPD